MMNRLKDFVFKAEMLWYRTGFKFLYGEKAALCMKRELALISLREAEAELEKFAVEND